MNSLEEPWIPDLEVEENQYSSCMDQYDFMDPFDGDFAAMFGQSEQYFDQTNNYYWSPDPTISSSSSTLINNIPNANAINSLDMNFTTSPSTMEQGKQQYCPSPSNPSNFSTIVNPDYQTPPDASSILNFVNQSSWEQIFQRASSTGTINHEEEIHVVPEAKTSKEVATQKAPSTKKRSRTRPPSQTYDHIIAERRRREQLSQLFVSLSALIPGLKKMDKSSVLEDAIKYLKHLQEMVTKLEEKAQKQAMESAVMVRKSQIVLEDDGSSSSSSNEVIIGVEEQPLPEIEARFCDGHALVRVQCEKLKGILVKLLSKVESLQMIVVHTNAMPFGNVALDITIIAELEKEFSLTTKQVVAGIRAALLP